LIYVHAWLDLARMRKQQYQITSLFASDECKLCAYLVL
jgi:hypothetical protein